ncbi:T9SS type A sorting domain-containing protein [Prolixibacteraceae bacterium JC049]|nr:T9SS type A sorting domain-containing protein [Prolixibacteraceae bacterium JC049]
MHMKRFLLLTAAAILSVGILVTLKTKEEEVPILRKKKFFTGKELRQQEVDRKLKRRAKGYAKPDKPSEYIKYHHAIRTPEGAENPTYPANYQLAELKKAQDNIQRPSARMIGEENATLEWKELGPGNVSGRTRGLVIDPDDATKNTWITGSVGGGIWRTTDAGESWTNLTPNLPNLSTVCVEMAGSNHDILYAGTGEGFFNTDAIRGAGMLKSTDRGNTWMQLESTTTSADFKYVNRLIIDPSNADIVVAVTNTGILKTTDGGVTWNKKFTNSTRIQHIVFNPQDFNIQYAGSNGVGVLKSVDAGENWEVVLQKGNGRYELAIAPNTPSTIYALNEDSELFISYDSGATWSSSAVTSGNTDKFLSGQGWYDNTLAVSPDNHKQLFIGGVNLYKVTVTGEGTNDDVVYSAGVEGTESFLSFVNFKGNYLDGGMDLKIDGDVTISSFEVRFGPNKSQKAYRFTVPQGATSGVSNAAYAYRDYVEVPFEVWDTDNNRQLMVSFRDQDRSGGFNLTRHDDDAGIGREYIFIHSVTYSETPNNLIAKTAGQTYNEMVMIWPIAKDGYTWNPSSLPESKIYLNKTVSKKQNLSSQMIAHWAGNGAPYVHADNHNIQITKGVGEPFRIVVANDGGVGYSDNGGSTWKNPTNGYNTTQFYGVDKHPSMDRYLGGTQDNGSWLSPENPTPLSGWKEASGGDGFDVVWHSTDPNKLITSLYHNRLYVSYNGGQNFGSLTSSDNLVDVGDGKAPFITQIANSPTTPDRLFMVGPSGISRSEDFGKTWSTVSISSDWGYGGSGKVAISQSNPQNVWGGCRMSTSGTVYFSSDGGKTFQATQKYSRVLGNLSGLETHPTKPNTAFALFSFQGRPKVLRTDDKGQTWNDISGFNEGSVSTNGFPDVAVYALQVMPYNTKEIWVGTEIGLFISKDEGATWQYSNNGLPAVSIWDIKVRGNQVVLATHGRGIWAVTIPDLSTVPQAPIIAGTGVNPKSEGIVKYKYPSLYDSVHLMVNDVVAKRITTDLAIEENGIMMFDLPETDEVSVQLKGFKDEVAHYSGKVDMDIIRFSEPVSTYANNFDGDATTDFFGTGFSVTTNSALTGRAIHSAHPYATNKDFTYTLKKPITITPRASDGKAWLQYDDIPMVEKGEVNVAYGNSDFYDYVVVQGTKDGINWKDIGAGYDFNSIKAKASDLGINDENGTPKDDLYTTHRVDLLEYFAEGDVILLRFKLHSDPYTAGWGWAIDNVEIQREQFTSNEVNELANTIVYPNPAKEYFNVQFDNKLNGKVEMKLWAATGKLVHSKSVDASTRTYKWDVNGLTSGNYFLEVVSGTKRSTHKIQVIK